MHCLQDIGNDLAIDDQKNVYVTEVYLKSKNKK